LGLYKSNLWDKLNAGVIRGFYTTNYNIGNCLNFNAVMATSGRVDLDELRDREGLKERHLDLI